MSGVLTAKERELLTPEEEQTLRSLSNLSLFLTALSAGVMLAESFYARGIQGRLRAE